MGSLFGSDPLLLLTWPQNAFLGVGDGEWLWLCPPSTSLCFGHGGYCCLAVAVSLGPLDSRAKALQLFLSCTPVLELTLRFL